MDGAAGSRRSSTLLRIAFALLLLAGGGTPLPAAVSDDATSLPPDPVAELLAGWVALEAPTGHEQWATDALLDALPGWRRDAGGSLIRSLGSGRPHVVVACALDAFAYAVTAITDEGYLRLHRLAGGSEDPLWDQAHAGQQVRILGTDGPRLGVTAVPNNHFSPQHRDDTSVVTADDLWVDVGAESAAEVGELGIRLLDPVLRDLPAWAFADVVAGPSAGARVGCAAAVAAAQAGIRGSGRTSYVLSTQQAFAWAGLAGAIRSLGAVDELLLLGRGGAEARDGLVGSVGATEAEVDAGGEEADAGETSAAAVSSSAAAPPSLAESRHPASLLAPLLGRLGGASVHELAPRASDAGALMERVEVGAAAELLARLVRRLDPSAAVPAWVEAPSRSPLVVGGSSGRAADPLAEAVATLDPLAEAPGVSGHEGPVRRLLLEALPDWARERAHVDGIGNLWVAFGGALENGGGEPSAPPPSDPELTVFLAHSDEVGFEVGSVDVDGVVSLVRRGGMVTSAWEGQPAVLHLEGAGDPSADGGSDRPTALRGVFLRRPSPTERRPPEVRAWFGVDGATLRAAGVREGASVTGHKQGHRIGAHRYTSRALDDRVGSAALVMALRRIDPRQVEHPVVFAWPVLEEVGLVGAAELARRFGLRTRRAYSVDTFVSSDTPLESPHFAHALLGRGPVLRSAENSSMSTRAEIDRNLAIAGAAGIAVQVGLTQGGTDGTRFTHFGAPNAGLSWPGRYSHSPVEVADLRDVAGLVDLIVALAMAGPD